MSRPAAAAIHTGSPLLYHRPLYGYAGLYGGHDQGMQMGLESIKMHGTTILCVRKGSKVVMMGDGQVSQGHTVVKPNAKKVRAKCLWGIAWLEPGVGLSQPPFSIE